MRGFISCRLHYTLSAFNRGTRLLNMENEMMIGCKHLATRRIAGQVLGICALWQKNGYMTEAKSSNLLCMWHKILRKVAVH